jgi:hypothetical protein
MVGDTWQLAPTVPLSDRKAYGLRPCVFCTMAVYRGALKWDRLNMPTKKQRGGKAKKTAMPRASVTFPPELYRTLEDLARKKKVSMAWVVREAAEKYVADEWPLFAPSLLREGE